MSVIQSSPQDYRGGDLVDRSSAVTNANASQLAVAANPGRKYLLLQNPSDTDMWVDFGVAAVADSPSIQLAANGGSLVMDVWVSRLSVNILCSAAGKKFTAKEA